MNKKDNIWTRTERITLIGVITGIVTAITGIIALILAQPITRCSLFTIDCPPKVNVISPAGDPIPKQSQVPNNTISSSSNLGMKKTPVPKVDIVPSSNSSNPVKDRSSKIHENYENDFVSFKYPNNWREIGIVNMSKEFVTFVSNEPSERLSVAVDSLRKDLKLEKIDDFLEKEKSDIKSPTSQASFVAMTIKNINGRRFGEVVSTDRTKKNKIIKSFFIQKDKIYTVTYIQKDFDLPPVGINIVLESINPK
jgi:hypothetical protein